jgi:hypothetical protein
MPSKEKIKEIGMGSGSGVYLFTDYWGDIKIGSSSSNVKYRIHKHFMDGNPRGIGKVRKEYICKDGEEKVLEDFLRENFMRKFKPLNNKRDWFDGQSKNKTNIEKLFENTIKKFYKEGLF